MRIGFIGLGDQGGPMARRIVEAGHATTFWARRPEALDPYRDTTAQFAESVAALGAASDLVGICVVDDAGVRQVCEALIPAMAEGGIIAIHSTVNPQTCIEIAEAARPRGIAVIDAPVSGGGHAAAAGTLTVMAGGDAEAVAKARPVWEAFAGLILHLGDVGAGQNAKLINNTMLSAHLAIADHALSAAEALKLDRTAFVELIQASSGRSYGFEVRARMPSPSVFAHGGALLIKDSRLLGEVLPDEPGSVALRAVADPFLARTQS
jgi:3-hydroxyisobutyrate dehydrogenase-like beta-hydroxyacid dehydrogenase